MPLSLSATEIAPRSLIKQLKRCEGAKLDGAPGDISILTLPDSPAASLQIMNFFSGDEIVDVVLRPLFGSLRDPYVSPLGQTEVFNVLATFQSPHSEAIQGEGGAINLPFARAMFPLPGGGVHFHDSKVKVRAALEEIQQLARFRSECPELASLPGGQTICDMVIRFSGIMVILPLRKR